MKHGQCGCICGVIVRELAPGISSRTAPTLLCPRHAYDPAACARRPEEVVDAIEAGLRHLDRPLALLILR